MKIQSIVCKITKDDVILGQYQESLNRIMDKLKELDEARCKTINMCLNDTSTIDRNEHTLLIEFVGEPDGD